MNHSSNNYQTTNSLGTAAAAGSNGEQDRSGLLREAVALTMAAAHGLQRLNENQISQMLGNLVRSKLLSADDSYRLRDQLLDSNHFERAFNHRVEGVLRKSGVVSNTMLTDLQNRLSQLEQRTNGRA